MNKPKPPFPEQKQPMPGSEEAMDPKPDYGEDSYKGSGKLKDKKAVITGGDSGIGRAVALAFAREGADVLISYYNEHEDAERTKRAVEDAGRKAILMLGDIKDSKHCRAIIDKAVKELGRIDILVNNAAHQASFKDVEEISDEEWDVTFRTNIYAMFYLTKAAVPHMKRAARSSTPRRSMPIRRARNFSLMRRPRGPSRIIPAAWRSCSPKRASASIASRRDRSGRH
jgi:NAD(P)-dependent dehydrogenase (short-subunit alcohol dehydrogenase family)